MNKKYLGKDQDWHNETTIYWFETDEGKFGVSDCNGDETIVDADNCPLTQSDSLALRLKSQLVVTDEMRIIKL